MTNPQQQMTDKRRQWEAWARRKFGDNETQARAAVDAALRAAASGASSQEAAAAGLAAGQAHEEPDVPPELLEPAPRGTVVGYARRIRQQQQISDVGSLQTLEFRVEPLRGPSLVVQMRGFLLEGSLTDGDVVEVPIRRRRGTFVRAGRLFNRTTGSTVEMRRGLWGSMSVAETMYGRVLARTFYFLFFAVFFAFVAVFAGAVLYGTVWRDDAGQPDPPSWFCATAEKIGFDSVPGC
ncbi:hypothetical protein [Nocardia huaxiensis]|uniref:Uncharacterized protein n=1 Tax=Nocardia huaxiensis TaxID=2755382 RepID=A0A7D6ZUW9_9NOCA|nr:hypothetical protein [Nocardia huaxiensis]QLY29329.1 hypothetical protein H0264_29235 [Nocardia huaxiensis]UFS97194.1 hypothetical protein LPY97_04495 [Nocardia huaxiensis]